MDSCDRSEYLVPKRSFGLVPCSAGLVGSGYGFGSEEMCSIHRKHLLPFNFNYFGFSNLCNLFLLRQGLNTLTPRGRLKFKTKHLSGTTGTYQRFSQVTEVVHVIPLEHVVECDFQVALRPHILKRVAEYKVH